MISTKELSIKTKRKFQIIDITNLVKKEILKSGIKEGLVTILSKHTTAAIRINEEESLLLKDIESFFKKITRNDKEYFHDDISKRKNCEKNEPKNAASHLQALLMGNSESLVVKDKKLLLGKWQRILFIELDGPRKRSFLVNIVGK